MDYIRGVTRNQVILFPESVEDYITEENPVRFIDAFVSSLDLALIVHAITPGCGTESSALYHRSKAPSKQEGPI